MAMESFIQLLIVLAFIYWTTPYVTPRRRPGRPPERPRVIGRFASTPGPERRGDGDVAADDYGNNEDGTGLQPDLGVVADQSCEHLDTPVRASAHSMPSAVSITSMSAPSTHLRRASVSSTASRHTVRWADESDDEDVKPLVNADKTPTSIATTLGVTSTGPSTSSSMAVRSSDTQTSLSSSRSSPSSFRIYPSVSNPGPSSTRGTCTVTRTPSTSHVTPSAPTPSSLRSGKLTSPAPAPASRAARTPVSSTPRSARVTPVPSSSHAGRMTPASSASRAGKVTTRGKASNDEPTGDRAPIPARSVSVVSMASTVSTWSENRRILDVYDRQFVWFKNKANTMLDNGQPAGTGWFESESDSMIDAPPDFSASKDVRAGDVFCHRTPLICQLWLWVQPADNVLPDWEGVQVGYRRWDGRKLSITKGRRRPSWVL